MVTKTFNVTKIPKLLKEESLDELEITPEQQDQTPKNDAGEAPVTTSSSDEKTEVTPSTEPTMVNPEDSKVETSNPVVEIDTSKEAPVSYTHLTLPTKLEVSVAGGGGA